MPRKRPRSQAAKKRALRLREERRTRKFGKIGNMIRGKK
jgi:hypothetical protein